MPSVHTLPVDERADVIARLTRVEGQAKGLQKMIEEGRDCVDIMNQISAVRAAATSASPPTRTRVTFDDTPVGSPR